MHNRARVNTFNTAPQLHHQGQSRSFAALLCASALVLLAILLLLPKAAIGQSSTDNELTIHVPDGQERWDVLQSHYFKDQPIADGSAILSIDAPHRAHDASTVPIAVNALDSSTQIDSIHLIVDQNPLPLAGVFTFDKEAAGWTSVETRIRINEYTDVRAIAKLADGSLHMVSKFVKASGGCSAPALGDMAASMANAGKMRILLNNLLSENKPEADQRSPLASETVIKISHPNNSGMQFDQVSRNYIPAFFVHTIEANINGKPFVKLDTNFSLSENPEVRLAYPPDTEHGTLDVHVVDSKGNSYQAQAVANNSSL